MNRIELLASLAKDCECLADVGCDHGFISITAVSKYRVGKAYACDIALLPLESARRNILKAKLTDKIETILSNGFDSIPSDFTVAIVAGMGGLLVRDIIKANIDKVRNKKLILQANKDQNTLREFMQENGFMLTTEYAIVDAKKYYEILVYETGSTAYLPFELKYGPFLLKDKPVAFIEHYKKKMSICCSNLTKAKKDISIEQLQNQISELEKVIQ